MHEQSIRCQAAPCQIWHAQSDACPESRCPCQIWHEAAVHPRSTALRSRSLHAAASRGEPIVILLDPLSHHRVRQAPVRRDHVVDEELHALGAGDHARHGGCDARYLRKSCAHVVTSSSAVHDGSGLPCTRANVRPRRKGELTSTAIPRSAASGSDALLDVARRRSSSRSE